MTQQELIEAMNHLAEKLTGQRAVLSADLPTDDEGVLIADGSELVDALRVIDSAVMALSRMMYKINKEGLQP